MDGDKFISVIKSFAIAVAENVALLSPNMETHLGCLEIVLYTLQKASLIPKSNRDQPGLSEVYNSATILG